MLFVSEEIGQLVESVLSGKQMSISFPHHHLGSRLAYLELEDFVKCAGLNWGIQDDLIVVSIPTLPFSLN